MIVAVILADQISSGKPVYFQPLDKGTTIERVAQVVLRGAFGGVVVASAPPIHSEMKQALSGFAVQHLQLDPSKGTVQQSLEFADAFRQRWEKAMSSAAERFGGEKSPRAKKGGSKSADWSRHRQSPDVKVRGLARSFERDGVMLFRGERSEITPELQARMIEKFGAAAKSGQPRPIMQPVFQGQRGYPILFDLLIEKEIEALPASTDFDEWLLDQLARIQDVPVEGS
jgi:CTP:molybdopterin cytidylyltransferase MocA